MSTMLAPLGDVDEGLRWATAGGVRVWDYIDKLLDERLALMSPHHDTPGHAPR